MERSDMIRTKKRHQLDMCHGSLADKILLFAIPLMASSMLQLQFGVAGNVKIKCHCVHLSFGARAQGHRLL